MAGDDGSAQFWLQAYQVGKEAGLEFDEIEYDEEKWEKTKLLNTVFEFFKGQIWTEQGKEAVRYLTEKRGYSEEEIKRMGLSYYPGYDKTLVKQEIVNLKENIN